MRNNRMSFNWANVGSIFGTLTTALSAAGVSATNMPNILAQIGAASNPNQSEELSLCSSIMVAAANPALVSALAMKLATEQGIPPAAAAAALQLATPGIDIDAKVLEIESIIRNGG